jgi:DNA-directed RNA polymerase subunit RPC12/RpoP
MNEFKFACPHCQQHLQCEEAHSGWQIQCPKCHHLIVIPPAPGKTAQLNPQSGMTWATYVGSGAPEASRNPSNQPKIDPPVRPKDKQPPPA